MDTKLIHESCCDFTELLSSSAAVPGGGGAAALIGAISVSLCSMSANLTKGKKKYAEFEAVIENCLNKTEELRKAFLSLVDEDAEAFLPLSKAYSIEKDRPDREEIIKRESLNACAAPMNMLRLCRQSLELLEDMYKVGNQLLLSDVGCGAAACEAAMKSAAMNVLVNTKSLKGCPEAEMLNAEINEILGEYLPRAKALADAVMDKLVE